MEAEGGGGNSSDSGSGGIIDVSTVSSNFNAPTPQASGGFREEGSRSTGRKVCPQSVEKVWFTDNSTGMWLLEEQESEGCDIPEEFLDVSLESEEEEKDEYDGASQDGEAESRENERDLDDAGEVSDRQQLCGWVPPQSCLIPPPDSPAVTEQEGKRGEVNGGRGRLSESELQRQEEKELELLFGYRPPTATDSRVPLVPQDTEKEAERDGGQGEVFEERDKVEGTAANGPKPRSNSTDSGVASISPHSNEGDLDQRLNKNPTTIVLVRAEEQEGAVAATLPVCEKSVSYTQPQPQGAASESRSTPEKALQRPRLISRLKTPNEKLQRCSIFSGSPVICSELEDLKETANMAPFAHILTSLNSLDKQHKTFTITPKTSSPTHQSSSSTSSHSEKSSGSQNASVSSAASCGEPTNKKKIEKKLKSNRLGKPACRGIFAYKAGTGAPPVKVVKRPPSKLKSLLPASTFPSVLPSQVKKPQDTKCRQSNTDQQRGPESVSITTAVAQPRKGSGPSAVRPSGLMQPGRKMVQRSLDPSMVLKQTRTFAKPSNPNPIKEVRARPTSAAYSTGGRVTTPTKNRGGVKSTSNPSTPTRQRGNSKQPPTTDVDHKPTTCTTTAVVVDSQMASDTKQSFSGKTTGLSTSILSSCSPSLQQSTPVKHSSHATAAATKAGTAVKAALNSRTIIKDGAAAGRGARQCEGNIAIPVTPKSSIDSTPSRRVRPKFSLSSIDSESAPPQPPPVLGNTYTEDHSQSALESTPKSPRKKRRSLIPTPARQSQESREVMPLVYNSDNRPTTTNQASHDSPLSRKHAATNADIDVGPKRRSLVPNPRRRRPLVTRNKMATGAGRKQMQKAHDGPLKPMNAYKFSSKRLEENSEPPVSSAKVVHSPVNKDDLPESPRSAWSPVRRKLVAEGEACYQCTKRGYRN